MRTITILLFTFFSCIFVFSQNNETNLVRDVQITHSDSTYRYLYIYNDINELTLETRYVLVGDNWQRREQTEWIYTNSQCIEKDFRRWTGSEWEKYHQINYDYLNNSILQESHFKVIDGNALFDTKTTNTYQNGNIATSTRYKWKNNLWQTQQRTKYEYSKDTLKAIVFTDYKNNLIVGKSKNSFEYNNMLEITKIVGTIWQDNKWKNISKSVYYYNSENNLKVAERIKTWDTKYSVWVNQQHIEYKYDDMNRLIDECYLFWKNMFWENDLRYTYHYNSDGQLIKKTTYLPIYDDFRPVKSIHYSDFKYDKATLIEAKFDFWGGETGNYLNTFIPYQFNDITSVKNASKVSISYIPISDTAISTLFHKAESIIHIYPNPSSGIFYFDTSKYSADKWVVTDLNGKNVMQSLSKKRSGMIDLSDLEDGIYLIQVFTADGVRTQKLIKNKR